MGSAPPLLNEIGKIINSYKRKRRRTDEGPMVAARIEVQRGVLTPAVFAMISDGEKQDAELLQLFMILATSPVFDGVQPEAFFELVDSIEQEIGPIQEGKGQKIIEEATKPLSQAMRQTSYAFAIRMIHSDKSIYATEEHLRRTLHSWIGIDEKTAEMIKRTMEIMANPPSA